MWDSICAWENLWLAYRRAAKGKRGTASTARFEYQVADHLAELPIGNLTSQFWSIVYMNQLDWFVVSELGCRAYLRYVDDFALFSNSKRQLWHWKQEIVDFLAQMRLTIHAESAQVQPSAAGAPWLGFIIFPTHRRLKHRNAVNFGRRLALLLDLYQRRKISFAELDATVQGWINHVRYGDTWGLRRDMLALPRARHQTLSHSY